MICTNHITAAVGSGLITILHSCAVQHSGCVVISSHINLIKISQLQTSTLYYCSSQDNCSALVAGSTEKVTNYL